MSFFERIKESKKPISKFTTLSLYDQTSFYSERFKNTDRHEISYNIRFNTLFITLCEHIIYFALIDRNPFQLSYQKWHQNQETDKNYLLLPSCIIFIL